MHQDMRLTDAWLHICLSKNVIVPQVLLTMETKFKDKCYIAAQARKVLTFETESVPVQQFQARCADHILFTNNNGLHLTKVRGKFPYVQR